ncbi:MAG: hypothetical protein IPK16_13170 [Anaerolineales bacterium]|nr:hypothetical protein [Anaerolineales bacterium]
MLGADIPPGVSATDGLVIHLNELDKTGDINFFKDQIVRFRQWMADRGYANKPLFVTEFGILMPEDRGFPPARVSQYLSDSFSYLLTATDPRLGFSADGRRLVQRFAWYSTYDATHNGSLFQSASPSGAGGPYVLSSIGQTFKDVAAAQALTQSPQLMSLELEPGAPLAVDGKTNFTLKATVGNSGSALTPVNVTVRFYLGDPAAGGVKIGNDQVVQVSGCGDTAVATVLWKDVNPSESGKRVYAEMVYSGQTTKTYQSLFFATTRLYLGEVFRVP